MKRSTTDSYIRKQNYQKDACFHRCYKTFCETRLMHVCENIVMRSTQCSFFFSQFPGGGRAMKLTFNKGFESLCIKKCLPIFVHRLHYTNVKFVLLYELHSSFTFQAGGNGRWWRRFQIICHSTKRPGALRQGADTGVRENGVLGVPVGQSQGWGPQVSGVQSIKKDAGHCSTGYYS